MQNQPTNIKASPKTTLVDVHGMLETIWPDARCRPSLRWVRQMQSRKVIPYIKLGALVFFDTDRVFEALSKLEVS